MNANANRNFGSRVRAVRNDRGLSQERLAELADLSRDYVGSVERGERDVSMSTMLKLARALGVPLAELLED